ncbi:hypothetical protein RUM44_010351 [Polyplax serrata]|uniref:Uncharacterized protein n=1 Tax=Polyplax serrata TaxID=468196 RepID=A0ABR1AVB7_POLSC
MAPNVKETLTESYEYLADVDDAADTTCWSKKRQRKLKLKELLIVSLEEKLSGKYGEIDCLRFSQDKFDSRPVTPITSAENRKFKFTNWTKLEYRKRFRKNLFQDPEKRYLSESRLDFSVCFHLGNSSLSASRMAFLLFPRSFESHYLEMGFEPKRY